MKTFLILSFIILGFTGCVLPDCECKQITSDSTEIVTPVDTCLIVKTDSIK